MSKLAIHVISDEEAEKADMVVCARRADVGRGYFDDDVETACHDCQATIVHRPHAPKAPIKVCVQCAIARAKGGRA